jgi:AraC-like DNA-binding protein
VRAALANHAPHGRIFSALKRIHRDYAEPLATGQLSAEAKMSAPAFHTHFKVVTRTSPIQNIKSTRLHWARPIMIRDEVTAAVASVRVGYESPSQFRIEWLCNTS